MDTYTLRSRPDAQPSPRFRIDYAGELNAAQHEAATMLDGPVLVIAGAAAIVPDSAIGLFVPGLLSGLGVLIGGAIMVSEYLVYRRASLVRAIE